MIPDISKSGSDACSVSSNCVFSPFLYVLFFSWQPTLMCWVKGTPVNRPLVLWWWAVGERRHSALLWVGLSLLGSLCLWTGSFTCASQVFPSLFRGTEWLEEAGHGQSDSDKVPADEALVKQFFLAAALVRTECSDVFPKGSFSLSPLEAQGNFSDSHRENLVKLLAVKLKNKCGGPDNWVPWSFHLSDFP